MSFFSTRVRYALRLMIEISRTPEDALPITLDAAAQRTGLSRGYLDQLVIPLRSASLLRGKKGPRGGYQLARPAHEITLCDIVEATLGPLCVSECVACPEVCDRASFCEVRLIYQLVSMQMREALSALCLADLSDVRQIERLRSELFALWKEAGVQPHASARAHAGPAYGLHYHNGSWVGPTETPAGSEN